MGGIDFHLDEGKMEDLRKNYQSRIQADVAGGDSIYQASNKVKLQQRLMQAAPEAPVFLKASYDLRMYRGVMVGSLVGLGIAVGSLFMMATNSLKKKER